MDERKIEETAKNFAENLYDNLKSQVNAMWDCESILKPFDEKGIFLVIERSRKILKDRGITDDVIDYLLREQEWLLKKEYNLK